MARQSFEVYAQACQICQVFMFFNVCYIYCLLIQCMLFNVYNYQRYK